jgi:hypothetical protein
MTTPPTIRGRADRLAFLIDTADYFAAFADAVAQARHSVVIIGWEIDSGITLWRDDGGPRDRPPELAAYLSSVLEDRPELTIHALCWDWSMVYTLEREPFPRQRMGRRTHPRLVFELDGQHPLGASHHEKLVVIDDRLAFIGGMDLGRRRWTPAATVQRMGVGSLPPATTIGRFTTSWLRSRDQWRRSSATTPAHAGNAPRESGLHDGNLAIRIRGPQGSNPPSRMSTSVSSGPTRQRVCGKPSAGISRRSARLAGSSTSRINT